MDSSNKNSISLLKIAVIMAIFIAAMFVLTRERESLLPKDSTGPLSEALDSPIIKGFPDDAEMFLNIQNEAEDGASTTPDTIPTTPTPTIPTETILPLQNTLKTIPIVEVESDFENVEPLIREDWEIN